MEMKELNKSQLILLALLLSFVTSIATGITTVTLMQQAPEAVTVPINRIVKQTVEKIVQVESPSNVKGLTSEQEKLLADLKTFLEDANKEAAEEVKTPADEKPAEEEKAPEEIPTETPAAPAQ